MKSCVYTYVLGSYDGLIPQPIAAESTSEFICFTDDPTLQSDTWQMHLVEPRFATDIVRSARCLKILGHERLSEFDATLSIDASVRLRRTPEAIIDAWLDDESDMALIEHSYRQEVLDEFDEVVRLNYDDRVRVHEQLISYSLNHADDLTSKPLWTGMMVRRQTPAVQTAMRLWFDHVLRFSRRDQLSVNVALNQSGLPYAKLSLDNFDSEFHQWPVIDSRRIAQGKATYSAGPMIAELRRARRRIDDLESELHRVGFGTVEDLFARFDGMRAEIDLGNADRERLEGEVRVLLRDAGRWEERWAASQGVTGATANLARALKSALRRRPR